MSSYYEKFSDGKVVCIDEEIPFEIPQGWEWCRFASIYWQLTDGTHSTPKYTESGIPFLSVKDMSSGKISFHKTKYISAEEHRVLSSRCNPQKGDLLLSKVGTTGIPAIVDTDREFSLFVSVALIKFFREYIEDAFLMHLINSPLVQEQAKNNTRGVGNKNWVLSAIANTMLAIPPFAEQKRIVQKLDLIMPILNKYESIQLALDELNENINDTIKKSILQEAIRGRLVPQNQNDEPATKLLEKISAEKQKLVKEGKLKAKDAVASIIFKGDDNKYYEQIGSKTQKFDGEIPFELPDSWTWTRVSSLAKLISGTSFDKADVSSEGIRILRGGNIVEYSIEFRDDDIFLPKRYVDNEKNISDGDIVIVASTGSITAIGRPAFVHSSYNNIQIGAFLRIVRPLYINVSQWLSLIFETTYYREHISDCVKGTSINNIKADYVLNMLVPLPPKQEQQRIVQKIAEIQTLIQ